MGMRLSYCAVSFLLLLGFTSHVECLLNTSKAAEILKIYDGKIGKLIPREEGKDFVVRLGFIIQNMVPLTFINNHIFVELDLIAIWRDTRFLIKDSSQQEHLVLQHDGATSIWKPDISITGEKGVTPDTFPRVQEAIRISSNGVVSLFKRVSMTVSCPMSLVMFPFDKQKCELPFESYTYNISQLRLDFVNDSRTPPLILSRHFRVSRFILDGHKMEKISTDYGVSGIFDQIKVVFYLKRDIRYYVMEYYFPVICAVFLSFLSFWVDSRSTPARVSLPVTTILTLTSMLEHIRISTEVYGAADALEIFLNVSNIFVFAVMVEYGIVGITERRWSKIEHSENESIATGEIPVKSIAKWRVFSSVIRCFFRIDSYCISKQKSCSKDVHVVDKFCRFVFPLSYITFISIYMIVCNLNLS